MKKKGFTLIELLVVITIMGILMGILLVSYQGARVSARDGKRKADLEQIRSALQMYHSDCNVYPSTASLPNPLTLACPSSPTITRTYMSELPSDPLSAQYLYVYTNTGAHAYYIYAYLEGGGIVTSTVKCDIAGTQNCNYRVQQP